jgi:hypothetical protein
VLHQHLRIGSGDISRKVKFFLDFEISFLEKVLAFFPNKDQLDVDPLLLKLSRSLFSELDDFAVVGATEASLSADYD